MAITLRHDAAAVALPSSSAQRKYGQNLVLQQQQQKYNAQQAGYDRLFDAYKQQNQNAFAWNQAADNRVFQAKQQQAQNNFLLGRDQAKFDQQQQQQRKADFDAARNRIDTHAKDMLANGEITDTESRQRIQNLIAGKTIVMGSDFDETARQNYLDQYNAELAKILSEVPPAKPKPPPQPNFYTDQNGRQWVESGPGKWEQVPQDEQQKPASTRQVFRDDEKIKDKWAAIAEAELTGGGTKALTAPRKEVIEKAMELYEQEQEALADPPTIPQIPAPPGTVDPVTGQQQQIGALGTMPGQSPQMTQQAARDAIAGMQDQMSGVRITDDGQRVVPAPLGPPMPNMSSDSRAVADVLRSDGRATYLNPDGTTSLGPVPDGAAETRPTADVLRADGRATYINPDGTTSLGPVPDARSASEPKFTLESAGRGTGAAPSAQKQPMPVTSNASSQNPWADVAAADGESAAMKSSPGRKELITSSTQGTNGLPQVAPPDFGKLMGSAQDAGDRVLLGKLQDIYEQGQSPEIQSAIAIVANPDSLDDDAASAAMYLKSVGIDLDSMVPEYPERAESLKAIQEANKKRFGNRRDLQHGF